MKIDILTLFPEMFEGPFNYSIVSRAKEKKLIEINLRQLRDWSKEKHQQVDDRPFGGGEGMILMPTPLFNAIKDLKKKNKTAKVILMSAKGKTLNQKMVKRLAKEKGLILICGHYEGVDERVIESAVDEEISIGDYVLTGGEIPAMALADAITRLIPGVLIKENATENESFSLKDEEGNPLLEYPQYTRPADFMGKKVPEILLSGNHEEIRKWRLKKAKEITSKTVVLEN